MIRDNRVVPDDKHVDVRLIYDAAGQSCAVEDARVMASASGIAVSDSNTPHGGFDTPS